MTKDTVVRARAMFLAAPLCFQLGGCSDGAEDPPPPAGEAGIDVAADLEADREPVVARDPVAGPGQTDGPLPGTGAGAQGDPAASAIETVDCRSTLPCASLAPDEAWRVELMSAGTPALDAGAGPRVDFEIEALTRDAELVVSTASSASADGRAATASDIGFGPAPSAGGVARHELRPGDPVAGHVTFEPFVEDDSPSSPVRLTLVLEEAGTRFDMAFENVPRSETPVAGTPEGAAGGVDCGGTLPCAWASDDGALAIDIDAIGLVYWHHSTRLIVDWSATAPSPLGLSLADAARAVTDEGGELEYYGIDFGGTTSRGEGALSTDAGPALPVSGRVVFRRAPPAGATSLASVSFELTSVATATAPVRRRVELRNLPFER